MSNLDQALGRVGGGAVRSLSPLAERVRHEAYRMARQAAHGPFVPVGGFDAALDELDQAREEAERDFTMAAAAAEGAKR